MSHEHLQGGSLTNHRHPKRTRRLSVNRFYSQTASRFFSGLFVFMSTDSVEEGGFE